MPNTKKRVKQLKKLNESRRKRSKKSTDTDTGIELESENRCQAEPDLDIVENGKSDSEVDTTLEFGESRILFVKEK